MKQFTCVFLTIILLLTLAACQKAPEVEPVDEALDWQTQYDLGVRYLSEGNYEEAILAFEAAIEIDPRNADAYLKLARSANSGRIMRKRSRRWRLVWNRRTTSACGSIYGRSRSVCWKSRAR